MNTMEQIRKPIKALQRKPRKFVPEDLKINTWDDIKLFYEQLLTFNIDSTDALFQWLKNKSELESVVDEDARWRYVKVTCDINNDEIKAAHEDFIKNIQPHLIEVKEQLNKKFIESPFSKKLDKNEYGTLLMTVENALKLHEDESIDLITECELKQQEYQAITGNMTIQYKGNEYTLPQANKFLSEADRTVREEVYQLIAQRRLADKDKLNELFTSLIQLRNKIAVKAGFSNFRDYKFTELCRNDYSAYDCFKFHEAIKTEVLPLFEYFLTEKKNTLQLETLRPWDLEISELNSKALTPFTDGEDLINKSIECFYNIHPYFGDCLAIMKEMNHLDLESRKGKAPGGYNMGLPEIGVPFIFMNAASSLKDMTTMVHEGGHAVHSFLAKDLMLKEFKDVPSEIAEVASMSMELISMDQWHLFFPDKADLIRAKKQQIKSVIHILPWVATIDKFQHWIYTHPNHTVDERKAEWLKIFYEFSPAVLDYSGLNEYAAQRWQAQLHLYEVPFYYIEYAIAQLAAVAMWKQYKEDGTKALDNYMAALKLGYSKSLPELYETAGIKFDFSQKYIHELISFLKAEYEQLG
jgi:oligoendopeptidase F